MDVTSLQLVIIVRSEHFLLLTKCKFGQVLPVLVNFGHLLGTILRSSNGGSTWALSKVSAPDCDLYSVSNFNSMTGS